MDVDLNLGKALDFVFYDRYTQTLYIDKGDLTVEDVGTYKLEAHAHFANATYNEHYRAEFTLEIRNDYPLFVEDWTRKAIPL